MFDFDSVGVSVDRSESCIAFVLSDVAPLSTPAYKAATSGGDARHFPPCAHSLYNGFDKITYFLDGCTPLASCLSEYQSGKVLLRDLVGAVRAIQDNGFLSLKCLVLDLDCIYVSREDGCVKLLYVPVAASRVATNDIRARQSVYEICELTLELSMGAQSPLKGIRETPGYAAGDLAYLAGCLGDAGSWGGASPHGGKSAKAARYELVSRTPGLKGSYQLVKDSTVLGRIAEYSDVVFPTMGTVSSRHCKLTYAQDGSLCVEDLGSTNGTYVNGVKLRAGDTVRVPEGSTLSLGSNLQLLVKRVG